MLADAIGTCLEVNREFVESYCSEDVRDMLLQLPDDRDMAAALVNSLGDAYEGGIFMTPGSVLLPVGEIEEQFEGSPEEWFAEPEDWTIDGNLACLGMESVRVAVDMETLREEVAERLPANVMH